MKRGYPAAAHWAGSCGGLSVSLALHLFLALLTSEGFLHYERIRSIAEALGGRGWGFCVYFHDVDGTPYVVHTM